MAITSSAKKAHRASLRKAVFNSRRRDALREATKALAKALTISNAKEHAKLLSAAYQAIDKAAKQHVISKNTAARKKSRLLKSVRKVLK